MRRRGVGIGAIQKDKLAREKLAAKGEQLQEANVQEMSKQMDKLRENLEKFATLHRKDIQKDPEFRRHFQEMCASIGVDPLASSKGFWSEMLGVGDFYYELGVQIIEVCMAHAHKTGGLMELEDLRRRVARSRMSHGMRKKQALKPPSDMQSAISQDDILRAIKKLKVLGNGFSVIPLGSSGRFLVSSVPGELSMDQTAVLQLAEGSEACLTATSVCQDLSWERKRAIRTLDKLVADGIAWLDTQGLDSESIYWIPSIFTSL